jgi:hypothetical protein
VPNAYAPDMDVERVTVVPNEAEAELACSVLRAEGIECATRTADGGTEYWGGFHEIVVRPEDAERARALLQPAEE